MANAAVSVGGALGCKGDDPVALGRGLRVLAQAPAATLNTLVYAGRLALARRHDPQRQAQRYARLMGMPA